jgi:endonuclease YncB( thermonuclease family)
MRFASRSLLLAVLFVGCSDGDSSKPALLDDGDLVRVTAVVKGDEVKVDKGGRDARVRLVGIYAFSAVNNDPQVKALSAGGEAALEALVLNEQVKITLNSQRQDSTGRYLAYLDKGGVDVNRRLVEDGWAVAYTEFPFAREADYLASEERARALGTNLWGLNKAGELIDGLKRQWNVARLARNR